MSRPRLATNSRASNHSSPGRDGVLAELHDGFIVEEGRDPELWVKIIGRELIRSGGSQRYWVSYGNRGNVDAIGVPIWIRSLSTGTEVSLPDGIIVPRTTPTSEEPLWQRMPVSFEQDGEFRAPIIVPKISAGESGTVPFDVNTFGPQDMVELEASIQNDIADGKRRLDLVQCVKDLLLLKAPFIVSCPGGIGEVVGNSFADLIVDHKGTWDTFVSFSRGFGKALVDCGTDVTEQVFRQGLLEILDRIGDAVDLTQSCLRLFPSRESLDSGDSTGDGHPARLHRLEINVVTAIDPNVKVGLQGRGSKRYLGEADSPEYVVFFETWRVRQRQLERWKLLTGWTWVIWMLIHCV